MLALLLLLAQDATPSPPAETYLSVPLTELELLEGELPRSSGPPAWRRRSAVLPRVELDGPGTGYVDLAEPVDEPWRPPSLVEAHLVLSVPAGLDALPGGLMFVPHPSGERLTRLRFGPPSGAPTATRERFLEAEADHFDAHLEAGLPGAAWFRHRRDAALAELGLPAPPRRAAGVAFEGQLARSFGLFSGGRAVAENLQLDRLIPVAEDSEESVALDSIEGITIRPFDWEPLLAGADPSLDPLAASLPADQHALFFPSFGALVQVVDRADTYATPLVALFEERSRDAATRKRYERQLCLSLDAATRLLGPLAVDSVAVTGSDPYLRTGSDVAVLLEARDPAALALWIAARQDAAGEVRQGELHGTPWLGVATPAREVSSYVARSGDVVVVANSLHQLERVLATGADAGPSLAASPEYRFFRTRYPRTDESESALLIVPDEAIRRWCGPRWRIAASRRMRAAAVLADLQARHLDELAYGLEAARDLGPDPRFSGLGDLRLEPAGVESPTYGTLAFQIPIAELDLGRVGAREAELYRTWKRGYERNWSNFFDPIALRVSVREDGLALDLSVLPLILGTDYRELRGLAGDARLGPGDADPHDEAVFQFALALDTEGETLSGFGNLLGGMMGEHGPHPLGWLGGAFGLSLDRDPGLEDLLEAEDADEVMENLMVDPNILPLVVHVSSSSSLKLAAFLASARAFVEQTAPGLLTWEDATDGERRWVTVSSSALSGDEMRLHYAATPQAWILSLHEEALKRAIDRDAARTGEDPPAATHAWLGESAAATLDAEGLRLLELFMAEEVRQLLRELAWDCVPILNEWHRRYLDRDPAYMHASLWGETLVCPGGGSWVWNDADRTMESSLFGHAGAPKEGVPLPPGLAGFESLGFGLTFEHDGVRARAEVRR